TDVPERDTHVPESHTDGPASDTDVPGSDTEGDAAGNTDQTEAIDGHTDATARAPAPVRADRDARDAHPAFVAGPQLPPPTAAPPPYVPPRVAPPALVDEVSPAEGSLLGDTRITLTGEHLFRESIVRIDGQIARTIGATEPREIRVVSPPRKTAGLVDVS